MLDLQVGVFHDPAIASTEQARRERLPIRAPLNLALASGLHPEMQDMQFGLTKQSPQA